MCKIKFNNPASTNVVSIIIPVFQDLVGLSDTIASIRKCLLPDDKILEVIVVNDGAAVEISDFCKKNKLVEVSVLPNKGSYHARNMGLTYSHGSLIGFVDADIFVDVNWVVNAIISLEKAPYVAGQINVIRTGVSSTVADYQQLVDFNTEWHIHTIHYGPTANIWVTRSLVEQIGGFNSEIYSGGDMEFGLRVFESNARNQLYARDVIVNHPPRTFVGLLKKSRRLASGHNVIGNTGKLDQEFTILASLRRNFLTESQGRSLPLSVELLRIFLFCHRFFFKAIYKAFGRDNSFGVTKSTPAKVLLKDHAES